MSYTSGVHISTNIAGLTVSGGYEYVVLSAAQVNGATVESGGELSVNSTGQLVLRFHETDQLWGIPDAAPHVVSTRAAT
jgi:autotransporter passenger strand-loop-strand repeat protein